MTTQIQVEGRLYDVLKTDAANVFGASLVVNINIVRTRQQTRYNLSPI
jgi:hypothetical protein